MLVLFVARQESQVEGLQYGGRTCRCSSWRLSGVSNNKSGQRLNGALVAAYVIVNLDHMALDLILCERVKLESMVHQDWPFDKAECDEHGQYRVRREAYSGRHQPRPAIRKKQTGAQAKSVHDSLSICSTNKYARSLFTLHKKIKRLFGGRAMRLQIV
jgi:hypothetical protein